MHHLHTITHGAYHKRCVLAVVIDYQSSTSTRSPGVSPAVLPPAAVAASPSTATATPPPVAIAALPSVAIGTTSAVMVPPFLPLPLLPLLSNGNPCHCGLKELLRTSFLNFFCLIRLACGTTIHCMAWAVKFKHIEGIPVARKHQENRMVPAQDFQKIVFVA